MINKENMKLLLEEYKEYLEKLSLQDVLELRYSKVVGPYIVTIDAQVGNIQTKPSVSNSDEEEELTDFEDD